MVDEKIPPKVLLEFSLKLVLEWAKTVHLADPVCLSSKPKINLWRTCQMAIRMMMIVV